MVCYRLREGDDRRVKLGDYGAVGGDMKALSFIQPYTWIQLKASGGSIVYVPAWK